MTSTFHAHDTGEQAPHAQWVTSPDFTAARAYVSTVAPDLLAILGLDGAEIRSTDARAAERRRLVRAGGGS